MANNLGSMAFEPPNLFFLKAWMRTTNLEAKLELQGVATNLFQGIKRKPPRSSLQQPNTHRRAYSNEFRSKTSTPNQNAKKGLALHALS